tara:strand:- start:745 stop:1044 length:300 start_codon:yes stop_codon:yes gene_type:complete
MILFKDILATIIAFTVFYTIRLVKAPLWWVTLDEYSFWSINSGLMAEDILLFIVIVTVGFLWVFLGISWLLIGLGTLVALGVFAWGFLRVRRWIKTRKK